MRRVRVIGGHVELDTINSHGTRNTIVFPEDYVLVHDPIGRSLDKCSLFVGPAILTDEEVSRKSPFDRKWYGDEFALHIGIVDVPDEGWQHYRHVTEMLYFRPGKHEGDWKHAFSEPQPMYRSGVWHVIVLPGDCVIDRRGIVSP